MQEHEIDGWTWLSAAVLDFPLGFFAAALYEGQSIQAKATIAYLVGGLQWCIWAGCLTLIMMGIAFLVRKISKINS